MTRPAFPWQPSRRTLVLGSLAAAGFTGVAASAPAPWRIPYGAAVSIDLLATDRAYRDAILAHCHVLAPEGGLKWPDIRPTRDAFRFEPGDAYVRFALEHGLRPRGHTLVWGEVMPEWTRGIGRTEAEGLLVDHVRTVVTRYAGRIGSWDVINEPMAPNPVRAGELRPSIWLDTLGPRHIEIALRAAAAADPKARLVINDYDLEYARPFSQRKRQGLLALVRGLVERGVPLHAVGLQGHLHGDWPIDTDALSAFVAALKGLGLGVLVTELDVIDNKLPGPVAVLDERVAAQADAFLGAIFAAATPDAVLTWGITDRFTWMPMYNKRDDGLANRPLPLDADYRPKPLMAVLERYCR